MGTRTLVGPLSRLYPDFALHTHPIEQLWYTVIFYLEKGGQKIGLN